MRTSLLESASVGVRKEKARVYKRASYPFLLFALAIVLAFISSSFIAVETGTLSPSGSESVATTDSDTTGIPNLNQEHQVESFKSQHSDRAVQELPPHDPALNFWVKRHLLWHDVNRFKTTSRKLIFRGIGAGLGDHIKALVSVYGYAVLTRRVLLIDWVKPYPISNVLSKRARQRFVYRSELDGVQGAGRHFNFKYGQGIPDYMLNLLASDEHAVFLKTGPAQTPNEIMHKLRGERWINQTIPQFNWAARRTIIRILLEPSIELNDKVLSLQRQYSLCAHNTVCLPENSIGSTLRSVFTSAPLEEPRHYFAVHARLGVGTGETHYSRFKSTEGNEERMAECFAKEVMKYRRDFALSDSNSVSSVLPSVAIFVASDTANWRPLFKKVMLKHLPDAHIVHLDDTPGHWRAIPTDSERSRRIFIGQHPEMLTQNGHVLYSFLTKIQNFLTFTSSSRQT